MRKLVLLIIGASFTFAPMAQAQRSYPGDGRPVLWRALALPEEGL